MPESIIQSAFNSGEWSPKLFARVDLAKWKTGAALLQNWFVDYRGGASTRPGTKYCLQAYASSKAVRLIPFQASTTVGYALEFGDFYIRFFFNGLPVLESTFVVSGATKANPCVLSIPGNNYSAGQWIFVTGIGGMTQLNGRYFSISNVSGANVTIADLNGVAIDSTGYGTFTSNGTSARVYTLSSPYAAADISLIKFAQNVSQMILCHPSYTPYVLTLVTATNWTLTPITFGTTAATPGSLTVASNLPAGNVYYAYVVTSIDGNGQESTASAVATIGPGADIRTNLGTNTIGWAATSGAVGYNVYEAEPRVGALPPTGATFGFIGFTTGTSFADTNIAPNFSQTPPIAKNPFQGNGVASVTMTANGTYTSVPNVSFTGAASTIAASATAFLSLTSNPPTISAAGTGYAIGDTVSFTNGIVVQVATIGGGGSVATITLVNGGIVSSSSTPANPMTQVSTSGAGTGLTISGTWGVASVQVLNSGAGYTSTPTVTFSSGAATATATLGATSSGFPSVPGFFQQRLILAGPTASPQTLYMSQPGEYFNFNVSNPVQATNSITATLVSGQLNSIKSMVPQTSGLLVFSDRASWLINGGTPGSAISPQALVANSQSFNGVSDIPPIVANFDVLYVQAKGSIVRDSSYNIYANVYTGTDISVISSHLFYGFTIVGWAWAEEPFKVVWAVRSDGTMLTLTFLKEQEFIGWAHSTTLGSFKSVCTVTETGTAAGTVDAVYTVVQRTINGHSVQYIERVAERIFTNGLTDAWTVDCAQQYNGSATLNFQGAESLAATTVTGLATDNLGNVTIITPFVMPTSGQFTLPAPGGGATGYTRVTIGLGFTCDLQTLPIDLGEPTVQGKVKKIEEVVVRASETLGLSIGSSFNNLVSMPDFVDGNISSMLTGQDNQILSGLVTGDGRQIIDPTFTVPGQFCIRQSNPYPATVLGVIPKIIDSNPKRDE